MNLVQHESDIYDTLATWLALDTFYEWCLLQRI